MHQHYQISNLIGILLKFFIAFNFGSNMRKRRKKLLEFWKNLRTFVQFFQTFLFFYFFAYTLFSKKFDSSLEVVCRCSTTRYWVWWMVNRRGLLFQWPTTSLTCSSFLGLQCSISVIAGSPRGSSAPLDGDAGVNAVVSCTPVEVRSTTGPPAMVIITGTRASVPVLAQLAYPLVVLALDSIEFETALKLECPMLQDLSLACLLFWHVGRNFILITKTPIECFNNRAQQKLVLAKYQYFGAAQMMWDWELCEWELLVN